jgi:hypothetical protein
MANNLHNRPTRLFELVPTPPQIIGATDASGSGWGGIFFLPTDQATQNKPEYTAYVWRYRLPDEIRKQLVSDTNPTGTITNSDLELAAAVVHPDVIATQCDISESTIATLHDNTPTVFWQRRGSTNTTGPAAYLLRAHALHARQLRYIASHDYIPGPINAMADCASRLIDLPFDAFLTHFNSLYPQPLPWIGCHPRQEMISLVTSASKKRLNPELYPPAPTKPPIYGNCGWTSALQTTSTHGSTTMQIRCHTSRSLGNDTEKDVSSPATNPFELAQWLTPCEWLDKHTEHWGPEISESINSQANWTSDSNDN